MTKSILVYSYYTNMPGSCQAEWIDDRMYAFIKKGYSITVVSATCCFTHTNRMISHIKAPALSPHAAGFEYDEIQRRNIPVTSSIIYGYLKVMAAINRLLNKLHIHAGEGRWSWFLSSFIAGFQINIIRNSSFIFTTGGPASAHLTGICMAKLFGKKIICELQDPLSGKDIGRNKLSHAGLQFVEKLIIRYADKTIYCTRNAMEYAREKYSSYQHKIFFVYPGSNKTDAYKGVPVNAPKDLSGNKKVNITYLGSLYQTRNLDAMMQAIDEMAKEGMPVADQLEIHLYGNMNQDIRERIVHFPYPLIIIHGLVNRETALQKGAEADVLLLIQNTDDRSIGTIPFKTYDYLHTGKLVLALTYKNRELEDMLRSHGHLVCQANDIPAIKQYLKELIADTSQFYRNIRPSDLTPQLAIEKMLELMEL